MKRWRHTLLCLSAAVLAVHPAGGCAFEDEPAAFYDATGPDGPYAAYARGHLGIPQPPFRTRHLVIAFNYLTGRPLSPAEQADAVAVNQSFLTYGEWSADPNHSVPSGENAWLVARKPFGTVDGHPADDAMTTTRKVPGEDYSDFANCLDPAFASAAATLAARLTLTHNNPADPNILDWVRAQDAVFTNCSGAGRLPAAAPAGAPGWLAQDRAYQVAAAQFYRLNFDASIAAFRSIAADTASPWATTARYLVARSLIRRATLGSFLQPPGPAGPYHDPAPYTRDADGARFAADMRAAQTELRAMLADPRMHAMQPQVEALLDYVNARIDPEQQAITLAARLRKPDPHFAQNLVDLTYVRTQHDVVAGILHDPDNPARRAARNSLRLAAEHQPTAPAEARSGAEMLASINALNDRDKAVAFSEWQSRKSSVWLLAALMLATPSDPVAPELVRAAAAVSPSDPAFRTATFHRLRLTPRTPAMRADLLAVTPRLTAGETAATANLFAELNAESAPDLNSWLSASARIPSAGPEILPGPDQANYSPTPPQDQACGPALAFGQVRLFTGNAAESLNTQMPLTLLADAAESSALPPNLHFWLANATWARAVLLDRPEIARRMTPLLVACRPAWKPVLDAYDSASPGPDRQAAALLALMRFASTEPNVRPGGQRFAFATYDNMRDNWWCTLSPTENTETASSTPAAALPPTPRPLFVSNADFAQAQHESAELRKIGSASDYFATEALAWHHAHPQDPRSPEILGEATRVLRNACRSDATPKLAKSLFDTLHHNYPNNEWTKRYPTWE